LKDEIKSYQNRLKSVTDDYENLQRSVAAKSTHMNQLDGEYNTINEKYHKAEHDLTMVNKVKG